MRAGCRCDRFARWRFEGFTRALAKAYSRQYAHLSRLEAKWDALLHDKELEGGPSDKVDRSTAEALIRDPLSAFPNDVDYSVFSEQVLSLKLRSYREFVEKNQRQPDLDEQRVVWTPARVEALNGNDPVSKRAAVNGELWRLYLHLPGLTLDQLRSILARDYAVGKLLPSVSDAAEYSKDGFQLVENGVWHVPPRYMETLARQGKWAEKVREVNEYGGLMLPEEAPC